MENDSKHGMYSFLEPVIRNPFWKDIPSQKWNSWIWQQQKRIRSVEDLSKILIPTQSEKIGIQKSHQFRMGITPYYASLIDPSDQNCPIRMQCVPTEQELYIDPCEVEDPLAEESHMPVPGLTHRYPDRVLLYVSHHCPVYCRHCTRKRKVSDPGSAPLKNQIDTAISYIEKNSEIRDVLVSGGDPLSLSDDRLVEIFRKLRKIPHVEILRLSTRNLVTLPQRISKELVMRLKKYQPVYVHTHFNHPKECTQESENACALFIENGFIVNNQMVLLKGINDSPEIVKKLNLMLLRMRVQPYYIIHCDLSQGVSHFRTRVEKGIAIIEALRGRVSGMAIPHYVVDLTPGGGKVALTPEVVICHEEDVWKFKNYQDREFTLVEPRNHSTHRMFKYSGDEA